MKTQDIKTKRWYMNSCNEYYLTLWNFNPKLKQSDKDKFKGIRAVKYPFQPNQLNLDEVESISANNLQPIPLSKLTLTCLHFATNGSAFVETEEGVFVCGDIKIIYNKKLDIYRLFYHLKSEIVTTIDSVQDFIEKELRNLDKISIHS